MSTPRPAAATRERPRGGLALALTAACLAGPALAEGVVIEASGTSAPASVEAGPVADDTAMSDRGGSGQGAGGRGAVQIGPSVELITGGNGGEGRARVGRLPVLD